MELEQLYKLLNSLEDGKKKGGNPLAVFQREVEALSNSEKSESKSKTHTSSGEPNFGDETPRPRESGKPNYLDPDDPLGLKGKKPGPDMFETNLEPIYEFYEQDFDDETGKTRRRITLEQMAADRKKGEELEAKIAKLESELRESRRDDPMLRLNETLKAIARDELLTEPIRLLGDAEPQEINAAMEELRIPVPDIVRHMAVNGDREEAIAALNAAQRLLHLNNVMRHAYLATEEAKRPAIRAVLWRAYKMAKMRVPDLLPDIPPAAWDMLFYTQAVRWNKRREQNMAELLQDMRAVGMTGPPTPPPDGKALDVDALKPFRGGRSKRPGRRGT